MTARSARPRTTSAPPTRSSPAGSTRSAPVDACGRFPLRGLLLAAPATASVPELLDRRTSGDTAGPRDRVVGYAAIAFGKGVDDERASSRCRRSQSTRSRTRSRTGRRRLPTATDLCPELSRPSAAFVTLERDETLLGCIGTLTAERAARDQRGPQRDRGRVRRSAPPGRRRGRLPDDAGQGLGPLGAAAARGCIASRARRRARTGSHRRRRSRVTSAGRRSSPVWAKLPDPDDFARRAVGQSRAARAGVGCSRARGHLHHSRASSIPARGRGCEVIRRVDPPEAPFGTVDFDRMISARVAKVRAAMEASGVATLVCCGQNNVSYLTAARPPGRGRPRAPSAWRAVAVLRADDPRPTAHAVPGKAPGPARRSRVAARSRPRAAHRSSSRRSGEGPIALDDAPFPLWNALAGRSVCDASVVLGPAKLTKTHDELAASRSRSAINEEAMQWVRPLAAPGRQGDDVSGAFLRAVAELGATANTVDPVFQVMPRVGRGRSGVPDPDPTGRARRPRRRHVDRHRHQLRRLRVRLRRDLDRRPRARRRRTRPVRALAGASSTACSTVATGRHRRRPRARRRQGRGSHARGCRTSTSRTASAPTAPRCRSSAPTSAPTSTTCSCCSRAWCSCSSR